MKYMHGKVLVGVSGRSQGNYSRWNDRERDVICKLTLRDGSLEQVIYGYIWLYMFL